MAQVMHCENTHDVPEEGHVMIQFLGSPDTQVCCAPCWEQWCWAFLEALPTFDERLRQYIAAMLARREAAAKGKDTRARKTAAKKAEPKDTVPTEADGESTANAD